MPPQRPPRSPSVPPKRRTGSKLSADRAAGDSSPPRPQRQKPPRVTIKHVAEAAGVSIATVSFVLNKRPGQAISAPVRSRVLRAAQDLNYAPSAAAAGLARKQTSNVAIAFYRNHHLITNQLYSFVVQGAIKEAIARQYNVLFSFISEEFRDYEDLPKIIREKNAEGIMFIQDVPSALHAELLERNVNVVAVDSHLDLPGLESVYVDNARGAQIAAAHLIGLGHRHIGFLRAATLRPSIARRSAAFLAAIEGAGLPCSPAEVFIDAAELTFDAGYHRALRVLAESPKITAIACANDELAAGVIRAAHETGRRVPKDLSVMGFDDIIMTRYLHPPLTSVACDKEGMGRLAMARLVDQIEARIAGKSAAAESSEQAAEPRPPRLGDELDLRLEVRASTGPAP